MTGQQQCSADLSGTSKAPIPTLEETLQATCLPSKATRLGSVYIMQHDVGGHLVALALVDWKEQVLECCQPNKCS